MNRCDNCDRKFSDDAFPEGIAGIPDLYSRLGPGGIVPAGECPNCGALCYPESPTRVVVDDLTAKRIRLLASELGVSETEVLRRAVEILATARTVVRGHEASKNERSGQ